ncbi:MAG: hypothetical protein JWM21_3055 [Acidobacteria bacterium]|nr:hypothetical protein [Acidobacteriota bacterium]
MVFGLWSLVFGFWSLLLRSWFLVTLIFESFSSLISISDLRSQISD